MKCLLCKGKGSFLVRKYDEGICYVSERCPRCQGKKHEEFIGQLDKRTSETFKSYSEHYSKYFKNENMPKHHNEILENL